MASITTQISAVSHSKAAAADESAASSPVAETAAPANNSAQAENEAAGRQYHETLSEIMQGFDMDLWLQQQQNQADLELYNGLYYRSDALVSLSSKHVC